MKILTNSPAETLHLGQKIAQYLHGGDILAISGELGAGKTVLIKGIAAGLGIKQTIRSPSFNLMKVYRITRTLEHLNTGTPHQTRRGFKVSESFSRGNAYGFLRDNCLAADRFGTGQALKHLNTETLEHLVHVDCYRLKSPREAIEIGLLDYLGRPDTVVAIEWPENIANLLKKYRLKKIKIRHLKENRRQITM